MSRASEPVGQDAPLAVEGVFTASADAPLAEVVTEMARRRIGSAVIVDDGRCVGIFTTADALTALAELLQPRKLTDELARGATMLITMGCGEACPHVPGLRREDWPLEDPTGKPIERVREIRDEVRRRVEDLIAREGLG